MNQCEQEARPIIIVGAGRSGTNMLRDLLCMNQRFVTWPCDEINYIWRYGNRDYETDELLAEQADLKTQEFIKTAFSRLQKQTPSSRIVEKTCANVLRTPFVQKVFPEAKFIHLVRDGRDVALSAMARWKAPLDLKYLAAKARYVPPSDLPYYASSYFVNRLKKLRSTDDLLKTWGPRFEGMDQLFEDYTALEACSLQWDYCVRKGAEDLEAMADEQSITVRYEDIVDGKGDTLEKIAQFVEYKDSEEEEFVTFCRENCKVSSKSRWKGELTEDESGRLNQIIGETLESFGYGLEGK